MRPGDAMGGPGAHLRQGMGMIKKANEDVDVLPTAPRGGTERDATIVYYDGSCPLCTAEINLYAAKDDGGKLHFIDVSRNGADLGTNLNSEEAMNRFHVRNQKGELLSGAKAFAEIWRVSAGWSWASRVVRIPGVLPVLEVGYRGFLTVRPAISLLATRLGFQAANPKPR
jgi:predicted DCC family thiol-disulfide oxidoreductase YuxK